MRIAVYSKACRIASMLFTHIRAVPEWRNTIWGGGFGNTSFFLLQAVTEQCMAVFRNELIAEYKQRPGRVLRASSYV